VTELLIDLGKKLAERWLTALVLPGLLLVGVVATGALLHPVDALSIHPLLAAARAATARLQHGGGVAVAAAAVAAVLLAGAAGLAAHGLGRLAGALWWGAWPDWSARLRDRLTGRRSTRWHDLQARVEQAVRAGHDPSAYARKRNRIAVAPPVRPTWMGDRIAGADARVFAEYHLDLAGCWPRLWLVLTPDSRAELRIAGAALDDASVLAGWAILYALAALLWWPSLAIAVIVLLTAWVRARRAAAVLADLIESAVDLNGATLATALGLGPITVLTPELGAAVTARCRKGA
jgi:hypothetical protein